MSEPLEPTRVGIGLIRRGDRFLIRPRPPLPGSPMPGYWEFPGGKCHDGETPAQCAARECLEEVGRPIQVQSLRRVVRHRYPHGYVELHFFDAVLLDDAGEPAPDTGFVWMDVTELGRYQFPGANEPVIAELLQEQTRRAAEPGPTSDPTDVR